MNNSPDILGLLGYDILHLILRELSDHDILAFCQTSRDLHRIALIDVFLPRHGTSTFNLEIGTIFTTSKSLAGVLLLFPSSTPFVIRGLLVNLTRGDVERNISAVERITTRFSSVTDVYISVGVTPQAGSSPNFTDGCKGKIASFILTFIPDKIPEPLIVIDHGHFRVSKRRRILHASDTFFTFDTISPWMIPCALGVVVLERAVRDGAAHIWSYMSNSRGRKFQDERIKQDVILGSWDQTRLLDWFHLKRSFLPSPLAQWTMVSVNTVKHLTIGQVPSLKDKWSIILPATYFPLLIFLDISDGVNLAFSDFSAFVLRHPRIHTLQVGHYAVAPMYSTEPSPPNWLPKMTCIYAPVQFLADIFRSPAANFPHLSSVGIGPWPHVSDRDYFPRAPKHRIEPFDFGLLDGVLDFVAKATQQQPIVSICMTLPVGSMAKEWLTIHEEDGAVRTERRLHHTSEVWLATEQCRPLDQHTFKHLVPMWFSLFPDLQIAHVHKMALPQFQNLWSRHPQETLIMTRLLPPATQVSFDLFFS